MSGLFMVLGGLLMLAAFVCAVIILIAAFKDAIWKGVLGLLCGLYLLYFAIAEFQHEKKWTIVLVWLLGGFIGGILWTMGGAGAAMNAS